MQTAKENDEDHSQERMEKSVKKGFDRADIVGDARLKVPTSR
jgi:hypothetical protein